jgi:hypothetical protein
MIWYIVAFTVGFVLGWIIAPSEPLGAKQSPDTQDPDQSSGQYWSIYVEATNDPAVYECVYERNNRELYRVSGRSVTGAMENMIDEIQP